MMSAVKALPRSAPQREVERATLDGCRSGDARCLRLFITHYEQAVFALLSRMLGRGADVEDLAQETFLRAVRALPDFDPEGPARPSSWLLTIATRLALDRLKRRSPELDANLDERTLEQRSPEHETSLGELRRAIAQAVAALPRDQRAAFVLATFHEVSLAEIAQALEAPENTVKTRLFRAREKLAAALAEFRSKS